MELKVHYDPEVDVLHANTGQPSLSGASLLDDPDVAVWIGTETDSAIVGVVVMSATPRLASYFMPSRPGQPAARPRAPSVDCTVRAQGSGTCCHYDQETDTLTLGIAASDPAGTTQTGDCFVGHWQPDRWGGDNSWDIIGVSLQGASKHLAPFFRPIQPVG